MRTETSHIQRTPIRISDDIAAAILQARQERQEIFNVLKERNLQSRILCLGRLSFIIEGKIKNFPDKQELNKCTTSKPALQEMLSGLLYAEEKKKKKDHTQKQANIGKKKKTHW